MRVKTAFVNAKKEKVFSKDIATKNSDIQVNSRFNTKSDGFIRSVYVCTALHKTILAARSPLFAAMFKHPSKEKLSGIVNVPDIEPDVFKVLLRYIYIGGAFTADGQISNWTVGRRRQISTGKTEESLRGPPCQKHL